LESIYLKTLVEVVRTGSLSRAAEALHVTQPAVSKRIKFMEEQYGCPLVEYVGNRMRPTPAGELVSAKAQALLEIEADLVDSLHLLRGKARVTFACTPAFGVAHLPSILRDFLIACADMAELKFVSSTPNQMLQGLAEGLFDAAVIESCERFDLSGFVMTPLPDAELVFAAAHSVRLPEPLHAVEQLRDTPLYTRREGCCSRTLLEDGLEKAGRSLKEFRRVIVIDDLSVLMDALLAGDGVSFLPADLLQEHVEAGRLRTYRIDGFTCSRQRAFVLAQPEQAGDAVSHLAAAVLRRFDSSAACPAPIQAVSCVAGDPPRGSDAASCSTGADKARPRRR
jgi:LysR family transcriptional regulator, transcriptional activator of the cysJI operon